MGKILRRFRAKRAARKEKAKAHQQAGEAQLEQNRTIGNDFMTRDYIDPVGQAAQQQALNRYQALSTTGFDAADQMAQQQANAEAARYEQSQRQAIMQNAQMRGMGGSGMTMQAQLAAQQGGADRAQANQTAIAQEARARSLDATDAMAGLGGSLVGQGMQGQGMQMQGGQMLTNANTASSEFNLEKAKQLREAGWDKFNKVIGAATQIGQGAASIYGATSGAGAIGGAAGGLSGGGNAAGVGANSSALAVAQPGGPTGSQKSAGHPPLFPTFSAQPLNANAEANIQANRARSRARRMLRPQPNQAPQNALANAFRTMGPPRG